LPAISASVIAAANKRADANDFSSIAGLDPRQTLALGMQLSVAALEETRRHARTNTMLAATVEFAGETLDVFVRNLSVAGAMIEGKGALPGQGDSVTLNRCDLKIPATVMWRVPGRCGLSFNRLVKVEDLIRRGKAGSAPVHQNRVDAIQRALRENRPVPSFSETEAVVGAAAIGKRLVDEIGYALRLIETVDETLANDAYILSRYGVALQQLDEVEQLLRKLAGNLSAEGAPGRC
jgi:hypothetical protein